MKRKVLFLVCGVFWLASVATAEMTIPSEGAIIEMDASGKTISYVIDGPVGDFTPDQIGDPGRCASCLTVPTLISPPEGANITTITPLFQWNLHTDPETTMVSMRVSRNADFSSIVISMSSSQKTGIFEYRFSDNLDPATTYYWRSRLSCGVEYGPYSDIGSFTTCSGEVVLPAPELVSPPDGATILLEKTPAQLAWSPVSGAIEYLIRRRKAGTSSSSIYTRTDPALALYYLDINTTYEWVVKARNDYGYGTESATRNFRQNLILESGDYDGDGSDDIAIFRDTTGLWAVRGITRVYFGNQYDIPAAGDYNGDGTTEPAIFRGSSGLWAARGVTRLYFGGSTDLPIPADYDGSGSCNVGIFRGSTGLWSVRGLTRIYFGSSGDTPVPGDYGNTGHARIAIFRSASGLWALRNVTRAYYGTGGDWPAAGAYFYSEYMPTIFRGSSGLWTVMNQTRLYFGDNGDTPMPGDYSGSGDDDVGIYRADSGLWAVCGVTRVYYGTSGDIPVTR